MVGGVGVFFFSSRRRHTRLVSDWSSDVCSSDLLTVRECLAGAERLLSELDAQREGLASDAAARRVDQEWSHFRVQWLDKFRDIESHCALNSRSRASLKGVYEKLDHIQDLYMTHAVQFAGEVGGAIDRYRTAVQAVQRELGAGRAM